MCIIWTLLDFCNQIVKGNYSIVSLYVHCYTICLLVCAVLVVPSVTVILVYRIHFKREKVQNVVNG